MLRTAGLALLGAGLASAQFVQAPTNLTKKTGYAGVDVRYKEVPAGICEQDPNVKSYSGFADVAENEHIFFWFFEARQVDPTEAPLTVWINGGPGSSSMIGLFQELGPCGVDYDGNVYNNPYSFSNVSNMLFIDQPTTTGLSYSVPVPGYMDPYTGGFVALANETCPEFAADSCGTYNTWNTTLTANSTTAAAPNFWKTLQGFMGVFPQYSQNDFFFTTESYGGHYGPVFNDYILKMNALNQSGSYQIPLKGVLIGNGWFDPILQYEAYYNFSSSHPGNTYEYVKYNASIDQRVYDNMYGPHNCLDQLNDCARYPAATNTSDGQGNTVCSQADSWCLNNIENYYDIVFERDEYDSRELASDPFPYAFYVDYLNTPSVQAAIGAFTNYSEGSDITGNAFSATGDDARLIGVLDACNNLISSNVTFVMYFGDADYNCNWLGGQAFSHNLDVPAYQSDAGFTNISSSDGVVHGQVKAAGNYAFVRIYESGHEVPFYQPLVALEMFNRTIHGLDIATGETLVTSSYRTNGTEQSTFINGNATVVVQDIPTNATYNTTTNQPNPPYDLTIGEGYTADDGSGGSRLMSRLDHAFLDHVKLREERAVEAEAGMEKRNDLTPWHFGRDATKVSAKFRARDVKKERAVEEGLKREVAHRQSWEKGLKGMGRRRKMVGEARGRYRG